MKTASLMHAVQGIIISVILLLLMYFFRDNLLLHPYSCDDIGNIQYCIARNQDLAYGILMGIIYFFYSIVLLEKISNNDRDGLFKTIKIGCITLAVLDILYFLVKLFLVVTLAKTFTRMDVNDISNRQIGMLVSGFIIVISLSIMVTFAIIRGKSQTVTSCYFYT